LGIIKRLFPDWQIMFQKGIFVTYCKSLSNRAIDVKVSSMSFPLLMTGKDSFCYSFAINDHEELKSNEQNLMTA
jgi:hypothetical protein